MIVNIATKLKNLDGTELTETVRTGDGSEKKEPITLEVVIKHALQQILQGDDRARKEKDFTLLIRIATVKEAKGSKSVDLSSEDVSRIKEKVYTLYDALIAGQVDYLLEGKQVPF